MEKLSLTYRMMRKIGLNYSEEAYGQVSLWQVFKRVCKTYRDGFLLKYMMNSWLLSPQSHELPMLLCSESHHDTLLHSSTHSSTSDQKFFDKYDPHPVPGNEPYMPFRHLQLPSSPYSRSNDPSLHP